MRLTLGPVKKMSNIITAPHPFLSQTAKPVNNINSEILKIIENMKTALDSAQDPEGVGLAAPQIGKSLRIFIAKPNPQSKATVYINPEIVKKEESTQNFTKVRKVGKKKKQAQKLEGCLSLKDIWGIVLRSPKITLSYIDEKGKNHTEILTGFMATIAQHETDHLDGILFPRRVLEQKGKLYKSYKEDGEDFFEEIEL